MTKHRLNPSGYVVIEGTDDYEQILSLDLGADKPPGGVLTWATRSVKSPRVFFPTKQAARAAITRTEHYRKAFGRTDLPEAGNCSVEIVAAVEVLEGPKA